jgi:monoamine oxidase
MAKKIVHPVEKGKRVTKLAFNHDKSLLEVGIAGESAPRSYAHVVSTVPFGCLRAIDTAGCSFPWALQTAIRTLHYDSSVKVGIQFSERWWEEDKPKRAHKGGASSTDRPSRTIVYPSYGIGQPGSGATMIASYTWAQDAARIGSLIPKKASVSGEPEDTSFLATSRRSTTWTSESSAISWSTTRSSTGTPTQTPPVHFRHSASV